jgi:hypothetical protein
MSLSGLIISFKPDAERYAKPAHVINERCQTVGVFAHIDSQSDSARGVIVAVAEPAIVEHEAFRAKGCVARRCLSDVEFVIEIDGFQQL